MLEVGAPAPGFELRDQDGEPVSLSSVADGTVVLYFYPRADTGGCTTQARSFRDRYGAYRDREITVLGVSNDPIDELAAFREDQDLPFRLLSDLDGRVARQYDSFREATDDRRAAARRNTYVIRDGEIAAALADVTPEDHAGDVLAVIDELGDG